MNSSQPHSYNVNRYPIYLCFLLFILLLLSGCQHASEETSDITFTAAVVSMSDDTLLVRPDDHTKEDELCSQIYVPIDTNIVDANGSRLNADDLLAAKRVQITYDGVLDNSDPAQIENCYEILILE